MITGQRTIRLTSGCTNTFSVHHEIGHALGLQHEHTRSDRDSFVTVSGSGSNLSIDTGANMFEYDFDSVMHYSLSSSISLAPGVTLPTGVTVGQRNHLSVTDIDSMRAMYPKAIVHRTVFASAGQTVSLCRLMGREEDAATKFALTSTGWNLTPEFDGDEIQFGSQVETGPMHRHCRIRSNFWANDYDYPNDDSSQYGSSSPSDEMFVDEQDIMILNAGLAPIIL
jgi:hypothetical protein